MKIKLTTYEPPATLPAACICDFHTVEYYDENGKMTGKAYHGISEQGANTYPVKAVYIDDDAKRFLWRQAYDRLDSTDCKAVLAVFPDILEKDAAKLKAVHDIVTIARLNIGNIAPASDAAQPVIIGVDLAKGTDHTAPAPATPDKGGGK